MWWKSHEWNCQGDRDAFPLLNIYISFSCFKMSLLYFTHIAVAAKLMKLWFKQVQHALLSRRWFKGSSVSWLNMLRLTKNSAEQMVIMASENWGRMTDIWRVCAWLKKKKTTQTCREVVQPITWQRTVFIDLQSLHQGICEQIKKAVFSHSFPEPNHSNKPDSAQTFDPAIAKSQSFMKATSIILQIKS